MKKILPVFTNEKDKAIIITMIILSMFLFFIPSLLTVLFLKEQGKDKPYYAMKVDNTEFLVKE